MRVDGCDLEPPCETSLTYNASGFNRSESCNLLRLFQESHFRLLLLSTTLLKGLHNVCLYISGKSRKFKTCQKNQRNLEKFKVYDQNVIVVNLAVMNWHWHWHCPRMKVLCPGERAGGALAPLWPQHGFSSESRTITIIWARCKLVFRAVLVTQTHNVHTMLKPFQNPFKAF